MAMFLLDLVFMLEIAVIASGLIVLHFSRREKSQLLKVTAGILMVAGVGTMVCTLGYAFKYRSQGVFEVVDSGSRTTSGPRGGPSASNDE